MEPLEKPTLSVSFLVYPPFSSPPPGAVAVRSVADYSPYDRETSFFKSSPNSVPNSELRSTEIPEIYRSTNYREELESASSSTNSTRTVSSLSIRTIKSRMRTFEPFSTILPFVFLLHFQPVEAVG